MVCRWCCCWCSGGSRIVVVVVVVTGIVDVECGGGGHRWCHDVRGMRMRVTENGTVIGGEGVVLLLLMVRRSLIVMKGMVV